MVARPVPGQAGVRSCNPLLSHHAAFTKDQSVQARYRLVEISSNPTPPRQQKLLTEPLCGTLYLRARVPFAKATACNIALVRAVS